MIKLISKRIISLFILVLVSFSSFGQINTELIKARVLEDPHENFYALLDLFKSDPNQLSQEQLNQLYYGSRFINIKYSIGNYNREHDKFWKKAKNKMSAGNAKKIVDQAEEKYSYNPLYKNLLNNMINIYSALNESNKAELCKRQKEVILQTIRKSGDGRSEKSAICVIAPIEVLQYIDTLMLTKPRGPLQQKMKHLPDGSVITTYAVADKQIVIKLVGGYFYPD